MIPTSSRAALAVLATGVAMTGVTLAGERTLDGLAGARLRGAWGWSSETLALDERREILVAGSSGPSLAALATTKKELDDLARAGAPVLALERLGTIRGGPAAVVSRTVGVWSADEARWESFEPGTSTADLDRVATAVKATGLAVSAVVVVPGGHVLAASVAGDPETSLARLAEWRHEALASGKARELVASGEEPDPVAARKMALYLEKEGELAPAATAGIASLLDALDLPEALRGLDLSKVRAGKDVYRRGSYGNTPEVAIRALAPVPVRPGVSAAPLLYQTSLAIDSDGSGTAWKKDPDGQSETSLQDANGVSLDPTKVPFFVLPVGFAKAHPGVQLGDIAAVFYQGRVAFAIYGDEGPEGQIGEGSILLAKELGIDASPTDGGVESGVTWLVFPGSGSGVISRSEIVKRGRALLATATQP